MGKSGRTDEIEKGNYQWFKETVEKRVRFLLRIRQEKERGEDLWPGQTLRLTRIQNGYQYYLKEKGSGNNGKYLSKKNWKQICGIAQRDYDVASAAAAEKELRVLKEYLTAMERHCVNHVYEKQSDGRKQLVKPVYPTDEECLARWEQLSGEPACRYEKSGDYYTEKGERVRSKSELMIANALFHAGMPYHYEYPLKLGSGEWVYPDFSILDLPNRKIYYWEHFGRMSDNEYMNRTLQKIRAYEENGIWPGDKLLMTFESAETPLGTREIKDILVEYFGKN